MTATPAEPRRFARLRPGADPIGPGLWAVPDAGLCLSTFLVVRPHEGRRRTEVLLGRIRPDADWTRVGALEPERIARIGRRWMLPSSQLLFYESPEASSRRIASEQLGAPELELAGPTVFSEAYPRPDLGARDLHWDFHFVFEGRWPRGRPLTGPMWSELAFLDPTTLASGEIARGGADVLALARGEAGGDATGRGRTRRR